MKPDEAATLMGIMRGGTKTSTLSDDREVFWRAQLEGLDAELATATVMSGINGWEFFPSWAEFAREYQRHAVRRQEERDGAERRRVEERYPKGGIRLPRWVKQWLVSRFVVSPPDMRRLPEQQDWRDPADEVMPADAHHELVEKMTDAAAFEALRKALSAGLGP